jgi:hypothetical protein
MVELHIADDHVEIDVKGVHQLLAIRRRLRVPSAAVAGARRMRPEEIMGWWKGWRVPGTHVPGLLVAGTYYRRGERHFWDVRRAGRSVEIELRGHRYDRLFVEVDDPDEVVRRLDEVISRAR